VYSYGTASLDKLSFGNLKENLDFFKKDSFKSNLIFKHISQWFPIDSTSPKCLWIEKDGFKRVYIILQLPM